MVRVLLLSLAVLLALPIDAVVSDSIRLDEVVVTGTRIATDSRKLPLTLSVVGRQQLTQNYQLSVLPTLMQQVPGLMITSRGMLGYGVSTGAAGGINMRGLAGGSGQLLVLIDGHPQYNGVYGHPISDSYQTLMADRVEVVRGPASVLYGSNAMGGVVNIVTRDMHRDGNEFSLDAGAGSWGTVQVEAADRWRSDKWHMTIAGQFARSDNQRPNMGFMQYGGYWKAGYDISEHWWVAMDMDITHFDSRYPGSTSAPIYGAQQWITRGVATASLQNQYSFGRGELSAFSNFGIHKIDDGSSDPATPTDRYFRSKDNVAGVDWWETFKLFHGNHTTVGLNYQHIYGRAYYTSKETGERLETQNKLSGHSHRNEIAGYVDFQQDLTSWLSMDAGVRLDHHSVTGTEWIPQAGLSLNPISSGTLKFMASKGFRNPTMRELYLYPTSTEDLRPERLWSYQVTWRQSLLNNALTYAVTAFYIKGDNMIQVVERKNVNTGTIENSGLEVEAAWQLNNHWSFNTNHSLLHMVHHVVSAPEYKGFMGADCRYGRFYANVGLQLVSGLFKSVGTNEQTENFCLLNATVNYSLTRQLTLWARGENLLAQRYEILAGYPMPRATFMGGVRLRL